MVSRDRTTITEADSSITGASVVNIRPQKDLPKYMARPKMP